jgi:hypothetical protein
MKRLVLAFLLLATPCAGQQILTEQQILADTIGKLFAENARLAVELQKAQARIKELEEKK